MYAINLMPFLFCDLNYHEIRILFLIFKGVFFFFNESNLELFHSTEITIPLTLCLCPHHHSFILVVPHLQMSHRFYR